MRSTIPVTKDDLDPHVRGLLEEVIEERDLDAKVAYGLLSRAQNLEGKALDEAVLALLRRA